MALVLVGLGNTGGEYVKTRHNSGRAALMLFAKKEDFPDFILNKKAHALVTKGSMGEKMVLVLPETMMNASGKSVAAFIKSPKAAKNLVVVHDDLDLPLGTIKMTFGRGAGGHKGVESVLRAIKTKDFVRIRIGVAPVGRRAQAKKIKDEEKVIKHVIGKWKPSEEAALKKVLKKTVDTLQILGKEGAETAMQFANTR